MNIYYAIERSNKVADDYQALTAAIRDERKAALRRCNDRYARILAWQYLALLKEFGDAVNVTEQECAVSYWRNCFEDAVLSHEADKPSDRRPM